MGTGAHSSVVWSCPSSWNAYKAFGEHCDFKQSLISSQGLSNPDATVSNSVTDFSRTECHTHWTIAFRQVLKRHSVFHSRHKSNASLNQNSASPYHRPSSNTEGTQHKKPSITTQQANQCRGNIYEYFLAVLCYSFPPLDSSFSPATMIGYPCFSFQYLAHAHLFLISTKMSLIRVFPSTRVPSSSPSTSYLSFSLRGLDASSSV